MPKLIVAIVPIVSAGRIVYHAKNANPAAASTKTMTKPINSRFDPNFFTSSLLKAIVFTSCSSLIFYDSSIGIEFFELGCAHLACFANILHILPNNLCISNSLHKKVTITTD